MDDVQELPKRGRGWAYATSAILHAVIAAVLFLKWPDKKPEPLKDEAVKVDIVQDKDAPKPPEQKAAEPPAPPPPPPKGEAKVQQPMSTVQPFQKFGEKDEGPKKQDGDTSDGEKEATDAQKDQETDAAKVDQAQAATQEAVKESPKDDLPGVPDILKSPNQQAAASDSSTGKPKEEKAATPKPAEAKEMKKANKLYSTQDVGGSLAILAMNGMPRPQRIRQLCASQVSQQLAHGTPRYDPDIVVSASPKEGNVLEMPRAYFRTREGWFEISYRCEVDNDASKVVSFAFRVGNSIPRSQWRALGFPSD
ncbi:MAG TPA: DUF930 domain-containing protein [Ensifer sp.]|nr:DUF930 domain-containing protein [Ensifer sp.]